MLMRNIKILDKQKEIEKLSAHIDAEERKLKAARKAFEEDSQKFNTFVFETRQVSDRMEEQFKNTRDQVRALDDEIELMKVKIEDVNAEIIYKGREVRKNEKYMNFI